MTTALETQDLSCEFGGIKALSSVSLSIDSSSITSIIGPNGAGKTTLFNVVTGLYKPSQGKICLFGSSLNEMSAHERVRSGLARTFQNIRLFKQLSVFENVAIAYDVRHSSSMFSRLLALPRVNQHDTFLKHQVLNILSFFELHSLANRQAGSLPYGLQRRVELARALATGAKVLLLDEPAAGLNDQETIQLMLDIQTMIEKFGLTIILIEHDMSLVMRVSHKIIVLDHGEKIAEGSPAEIQNNPRVIDAYLGTTTSFPEDTPV